MVAEKTILVVDDEEPLVLALKVRLEHHGYHVVTAGDGQEAIQIMQTEKPDLVILDVMMPVMDGYTCVRELNRCYGKGRVPVIILTARDRMKDLFELESVEDYMIKPFDHDELLKRIEQVLQRREAASS